MWEDWEEEGTFGARIMSRVKITFELMLSFEILNFGHEVIYTI